MQAERASVQVVDKLMVVVAVYRLRWAAGGGNVTYPLCLATR